ncbi:histidine phosphatase family protein [Zhongshania sp.]|uniref:SixA phosphatase family protein n=1 Tax=Zhongshania sp. TaxID=1971902 RepID=UPI003563D995
MEILLVRHGAASWDTQTDIERTLTAAGKTEICAAAEWLTASQWQPEELWVSPYKRAVESAEIFNRQWQLRPRLKSSLTPETPLSDLETMLATFKGERLMLVAHNPLLSNAINHWHGGGAQSYWGMQTASMAMMQGDVFSQACASLQWLRHYPNFGHNGR